MECSESRGHPHPPDVGHPQPVYSCDCWVHSNIFVTCDNPKLQGHFNMEQEDQFEQDYGKSLRRMGEKAFYTIKHLVLAKKRERENATGEKLIRLRQIAMKYTPACPDIYVLDVPKFVIPSFVHTVEGAKQGSHEVLDSIDTVADGVYKMPIFTSEFCQKLIAECDYFNASDLPKGRPNTMNNYGLNIDELGMSAGFTDQLFSQFISPLAAVLYPEWWPEASSLDTHKAFIVRYEIGQDVELCCHWDDAEVTLNVCLGAQFNDGDLLFHGMRDDRDPSASVLVSHDLGVGVLHRGQHMHAATAITSGTRYNLIVWCRSHTWRATNGCPSCGKL